jgi:hypothetical protein
MPTKKSQFLGFLLTFLFGPLGLFYSNAVMAVIYFMAMVSSAMYIGDPQVASLAYAGIYILSLITTFITVSAHNRKVEMIWIMRR